jgi:two-component sensor histidine kinase
MIADSRVPLEHVITTAELSRRASRPPDYACESRALAGLMTALANQPNADSVLQKLVATALDLCRAHSAGISILEKGANGDVFRWQAVAGSWSVHRGEIMPRESPCGAVVDRNSTLLMAYPERHFAYARNITLPIAELLLVPLSVCGKAVGAIWIIAHDQSRRFEAEDQRLMTTLGRFAEGIYQLLSQERLATELAATTRLQEISSELLGERQVEGLYEKILDAAASLMHSDVASIQIYHPEREELTLLANRGFTVEAADTWRRVTSRSATPCGMALGSARRVVLADLEESGITGDDLEKFRQAGIRASQSTPLISRGGQILGMISTHWRQPTRPREQDLHYLDILARQAADLIERSLAERRTRVLLREVSHRAKNILAVVQGMVRQTATQKDPDVFAQDLSARLAGLARSHDLLVAADWQGVQLSELVRSQVSHLRDLGGTRITFDGPMLRIPPRSAQVIGIAVHELATNALKFGALSNIDGCVVVRWHVSDGPEPRFVMTWRERFGPSVSPPQREGFGHTAMIRMIEHAFDADVALNYDAEGVAWEMTAPVAAVLEDGGLLVGDRGE